MERGKGKGAPGWLKHLCGYLKAKLQQNNQNQTNQNQTNQTKKLIQRKKFTEALNSLNFHLPYLTIQSSAQSG